MSNPIIAKFLKVHKFVREFGEGVDRMYRELQEAGSPSPKYEQIAFMIVGTAYSSMSVHSDKMEHESSNAADKKQEDESSEKSSEKVLGLMRENPEIAIQELAGKLSITTRGAEKIIAKLKSQGLITRIGPDKGGHWQVNEIEKGK